MRAMQVLQHYSDDKEEACANTVAGNPLQLQMLQILQLMQKEIHY